MMGELDIQAALVAALKKEGGWGWKVDSKHLSGLPDLVLIHPTIGTMFMEIKLVLRSGIVLISPIQTEVMKRMQKAGAVCMVAAMGDGTNGRYVINYTVDPAKTKIDNTFGERIKERGESWPVLELMRQGVTLCRGAGCGRLEDITGRL